MRIRLFQSALLAASLGAATVAGGAQAVGLVSPAQALHDDGSLLPTAFSGWQKAKGAVLGTDAAKADASRSPLLRETGLQSFEHATYSRQGRALRIQAYRLADATSALAAYSALREGPMATEKFCEHAGSSRTRVLLACADLVVQVDYDKVTAMTPSEMRSLVSQLPKSTGNAALPANAPLYLPKDWDGDLRFALGPVGLARIDSPVSADIIDFSKGAEVVVSHFDSLEGPAVLTIVKYPTFAIAAERQRAMEEFSRSRPKPAPDASQLDTFYTRRVGPIVAVVTGSISAPDASTIAEKIPYDVEVTRNEMVGTQKDNVGNLIVNILYLSFLMIGFAFVTGIAFGGFRILARKYFPGRFVDRPEDVEFIKLDLRE